MIALAARTFALALFLCASAASLSAADEIDTLAATVTFVVSTGYWEDARDPQKPERGYYKLVSIRQPDRTAKVYLQQIVAKEAGPEVVSSVEIEDISALKPYVTDIRPESSAGAGSQPGLFATVFLKTDPNVREPESWTVMIDDLGELRVEKATN